MKIKAHILQGPHWTGTHDETLEFYRRITQNWLGDARYRGASYARHFDPALLNRAIRAMDALQRHLAEVGE